MRRVSSQATRAGTDSFLLSLPQLLSLLFSQGKLVLHVQDSQGKLFCDLFTLIRGSLLVDRKKKSINNSSQRHTAALANVIHHVELQTYFLLFFVLTCLYHSGNYCFGII